MIKVYFLIELSFQDQELRLTTYSGNTNDESATINTLAHNFTFSPRQLITINTG